MSLSVRFQKSMVSLWNVWMYRSSVLQWKIMCPRLAMKVGICVCVCRDGWVCVCVCVEGVGCVCVCVWRGWGWGVCVSVWVACIRKPGRFMIFTPWLGQKYAVLNWLNNYLSRWWFVKISLHLFHVWPRILFTIWHLWTWRELGLYNKFHTTIG